MAPASSTAGASSAASSPPSPPPPDRFDQPMDVWNPGGDPAVLRRAAQAWRDTAHRLRAGSDALASRVSQLGGGWQGPASEAFDDHWEGIRTSVTEGAGMFDQVAAQLEEVAAHVEETNQQVHALYVAIGATIAVGVAVSVITVGFGSAAAAAAGAAQAQQAATIVARLGTFLTISASTMSGFRAALVVFGQRWAVSAIGNMLATGAQKAILNRNHNPLDGWTPFDFTKIVVSTTAGAGVNTVAAHSARWSPLARAHPFRTSFGTGFVGNGGASMANDVWVDGRAWSQATARNALVNGLAGGASGTATSGAARLLRGRSLATSSPYSPQRLVLPTGTSGLRVVRSALWAPSARHLIVPRPSLWVPRPLRGATLEPAPAPVPPVQGPWDPDALVGIPIDAALHGGATAPFTDQR